jgi:acyl dehydratase
MSDSPGRVVTSPDQLQDFVGQELGVSPWLEITQDRVDAFADATGDHQFIHVDPERAARTPFGGTIAHGLLTLSLVPSLGDARTGVVFDLQPRMRINYGLNRVRFPAPVRVGKRVRLRTTLQSVEPVGPDVYQLVYLQTMEIEGETKPALVAETISRLYL